jgi:hypothetical protein
MLLKKGNFYVIEVNVPIQGYNEDGELVLSDPSDELDRYVVIFHNEPDFETNIKGREATKHETQFWLDSMVEADELFENDFAGVSLAFFEEWKESKGII